MVPLISVRSAEQLLTSDIETHAYTLFPFFLPTTEARPLLLVLPGGGYQHWALEKEGQKVALWLNELGYHAVVLTYPVQHNLAIDYIETHFSNIAALVMQELHATGAQAISLGIIGFSAGAHLSALAANLLPKLYHFSILSYPVVSFCAPFAHLGSVQNFLGPSAAENQKKWYSTHRRVTKQTGPTFLWHTAADQSVPVANTLLYAQALATHSVPFECHIFPEGPHGLGLAPDLDIGRTWTQLAAKWLQKINS